MVGLASRVDSKEVGGGGFVVGAGRLALRISRTILVVGFVFDAKGLADPLVEFVGRLFSPKVLPVWLAAGRPKLEGPVDSTKALPAISLVNHFRPLLFGTGRP